MSDCCQNKDNEILELQQKQRKVLIIVLLLNAMMFAVEFSYGVISQSTALMADSLDMLGDAIVYALGLYVIAKGPKWKAISAVLKGLIMILFGLYVLVEALNKIQTDIMPAASIMGPIAVIALLVNLICVYLLFSHRDDDINMNSTWICSRNDIIANTSVIAASCLVWAFKTKWPDIIVGLALCGLFLKSAFSVLSNAYKELK